MKSQIVQNGYLDTVLSNPASTYPRKRELAGKWITVGGKLTWQWNIKRS
jgi:hypothetical protein